jgi:hypothetical protein
MLKVMVTAAVVLQRFAVPVGDEQVSFVFVVEVLLLGVFLVRGLLVIERNRTLLYLVAAAACLAAATLAADRGDESSLLSLLLLLAIYAPFCFTLTPSLRSLYRPVLQFFVTLMSVIAVIALVQMLLQLAGWRYEDLLLANAPEELLLEGYNTSYPVQYGSAIIKSNAFIFLEPSFLSQFLALAFIIELTLEARLWRLVLLLGALLTTLSGTGVILLAFGIAFVLLKRTGITPVRVLVPLVVAVGVLLATPVGTLFNTRVAEERGDATSSTNARFIEPYKRVYDDLSGSVEHLVIGGGPGSAQRDADDLFVRRDLALLYPVVPKLMFEYGLFAGFLFAGFIAFAFLNRTPSLVVASAALLMQFFLSGGLLQPHTVYLCYILTSLFAATRIVSPSDGRRRRRLPIVATT